MYTVQYNMTVCSNLDRFKTFPSIHIATNIMRDLGGKYITGTPYTSVNFGFLYVFEKSGASFKTSTNERVIYWEYLRRVKTMFGAK